MECQYLSPGKESEGHYGCLLPLTNTGGTGELSGDHPCFCFAVVIKKEAY